MGIKCLVAIGWKVGAGKIFWFISRCRMSFQSRMSKQKSEINGKLNVNPDAPDQYYSSKPKRYPSLFFSFFGDIQPQNSITYVLIFSAIGLLILLIACFNYINLLTANATTRGTEIGVRKAFGASRTQLAMQYISESIVVFFISFFLS